MLIRRLSFIVLAVGIAACEGARTVQPAMREMSAAFANSMQSVVAHVNGEGVVNVGVPMYFTMTALLREDGSATGEAFHNAPLNGTVIEFRTRVTCVSFDPVNKRAWIGGVIVENNSTDPARMQPRNAVGRDIWWRVVDYGDGGSGTPDRSTFLGFTGDANIQTSAEYCAVKPWPGPADGLPQDARTAPLISGNITYLVK